MDANDALDNKDMAASVLACTSDCTTATAVDAATAVLEAHSRDGTKLLMIVV